MHFLNFMLYLMLQIGPLTHFFMLLLLSYSLLNIISSSSLCKTQTKNNTFILKDDTVSVDLVCHADLLICCFVFALFHIAV